MRKIFSVFALCTLLQPANLAAQSVRGMVVDSATGKGVSGATVMVYEGRRVAADVKTDSSGTFEIPIAPSSALLLHITALGFDPFTMRLQSGMNPFSVRLQPAPVAVEGVSVSVERRDPFLNLTGFYQRKRSEIGSFIAREQIEKRNPHRVSDLFHGVAGARLIPRGAGFEVVARRFSTGPGNRSLCLPKVYLDGAPAGRGGLDQLVQPDELLGIEAYMSASRVPAQYGGSDAACGVILLWTRLKS